MDDRTASELALLTNHEMGRADGATIDGGMPGERLMENAGAAVARAIAARWSPQRTVVLCGPGNNGGDGFVVARLLARQGWPVRVALLGERGRLKGDAGLNAGRWEGAVDALSPGVLEDAELVVDALFGAGLSRPLEGAARETIEACEGLPLVAVDVPSGIDGDTGAVLGAAPAASLTVTFFRRKPGHLLLPGRVHCGETILADIGIRGQVLADIAPRQAENGPGLWGDRFPVPRPEDHKYSRGHVVVVGGGTVTGAARLAARGAMRAGAGMVSVACPAQAAALYAADLPGALIRPFERTDTLRALIEDRRTAAVLVGPGNGVNQETRSIAAMALATGKPVVLDADALSVFEDDADALARAVRSDCVLTPHDGEFARLFDADGSRLDRARAGAAASGAALLLKGYDTVIAAPDGRAAINANAPAWLATAGAGDVLAGFVLALMGQGIRAYDAACAAAWLHGAAATARGPGLIAEDLPEATGPLLRELYRRRGLA